MPPSEESPPGKRKLIGDLTVDDARHILHSEGGALTGWEIAYRLASVVAVSALTLRAIEVGDATAWHLVLPMVAQYLALILALPVLYVAAPHPDLRKDVVASLRLWVGLAVVAVIAVGVRSWMTGAPWREQFSRDAATAWDWIADAKMQWPILLAFVGELLAIPARVRNLYEHGPPFVGVSLGCAMRLVVVFLGAAAIPWAVGSGARMVWFLWWMILVAELLALWMHWDIQRQLRKLDARVGEAALPRKHDSE